MAACAELLFASDLQPSDAPNEYQVRAAIRSARRRYGIEGCLGIVATEYGDHPETAAHRMIWARGLVRIAVAHPWALAFGGDAALHIALKAKAAAHKPG